MPTFHDENAPKFTKVEIVCKEARLESLKNAMMDLGITGMTVSQSSAAAFRKASQNITAAFRLWQRFCQKYRLRS